MKNLIKQEMPLQLQCKYVLKIESDQILKAFTQTKRLEQFLFRKHLMQPITTSIFEENLPIVL